MQVVIEVIEVNILMAYRMAVYSSLSVGMSFAFFKEISNFLIMNYVCTQIRIFESYEFV